MAEIFRHAHRVTYAECTVGNHIYYARYLNILEEARGELFRTIGLPLGSLQEQDTIFPVVEVHLEYKAPARYDDLLAVEISIRALKGVRVNFGYWIRNQRDELLLTGETFHVCTSLGEKPKRLPEDVLLRLKPYLIERSCQEENAY